MERDYVAKEELSVQSLLGYVLSLHSYKVEKPTSKKIGEKLLGKKNIFIQSKNCLQKKRFCLDDQFAQAIVCSTIKSL